MSIKVNIKVLAGGTSEQIIEVEENTTYECLLDDLEINQETVIVLKDGQAVPLDGTVTSSDITILKIVSGG
ncbi:MAG: MoaD/ThiS family protein [Methanosarcinaceae archaeon]|nr:MoaD/ThiS family protein [Methanosarcinaceae archaeon]